MKFPLVSVRPAAWLLILAGLVPLFPLRAQTVGQSPSAVQERVLALVAAHPEVAQVRPLGQARGGQNLWLLTLSADPQHQNQPGLAVVGGVDGRRLVTVELALRIAGHILENKDKQAYANLLANYSLYIIPNADPATTARLLGNGAGLPYNTRPTDLDHDGHRDEDGPDDQNGDGRISLLRIEQPGGEWLPHPDDERLMIRANPAEGLTGTHDLTLEGRDSDQDGRLNEDPRGGVRLNRNFTYQYPHHAREAGPLPVSEPGSRALADFFYDRWNIYGVLWLGPDENLLTPWTPGGDSDVPASITAADAPFFKGLAKAYGERVKLNERSLPADKAGKTEDADANQGKQAANGGGSLLPWGYFHYGRLSLGTPGWRPPAIKPDSGETAPEPAHLALDFLAWADSIGLDLGNTAWQAFNHPDYAFAATELGGFPPFRIWTSPAQLPDSLTAKHADFLLHLSEQLPQLRFGNVKVFKRGEEVYQLDLELFNAGGLPALLAIAEENRWLKQLQAELDLADGQELLGGRKRQALTNLQPGQPHRLSWLIRGAGRVRLHAGAPHVRSVERELMLN